MTTEAFIYEAIRTPRGKGKNGSLHSVKPISLVTGLIVLMIGLALIRVGIQYSAGGVPLMGKPEFGSLSMWVPALVVIVVTLAIKFFARGFLSVAAVFVGIVAGDLVALAMGPVRPGWATTQARATWAGVAECAAAT